ncbi:MAG TPA: SpoIIE family protein phosphatase [Chthoniobacterales bacterium]|nr:SpoIIE family protein phosphatase [Chthoniobacterales bacterium]
MSNIGDAVIVAGREDGFLIFNPAAQRMFGEGATDITLADWSGRKDLYLPDKVTLFPSDQTPLARAIRGEETKGVEMFVRQAQAPRGLWARINGWPLRAANGEVAGGVIVCRDITEAKEEEFFRAGQTRILELIAEDAPLSEILTSLVLLMEGQAEGLRCSVLLLGRDGIHVQHGAAPNLPEVYVKAVDGAPIGPRAGSCGTAMFTRQPVVVTDVLTDPLWADYHELAKISGLRACWSTPILSMQGGVLGSFAMYRQESRGPHAEEMRLTKVATHLARIAIERQRAQAELLAVNAQLENRVAERTRELQEKNRQMAEELQMARELQFALLPKVFPAIPVGASPQESALGFLSLYFPTGDVSGDFFSVFPVSEKATGVLICDVMGHGVRSALITGLIRGLIEEHVRFAADPGVLLTHINRALAVILQQAGTTMFATCFYVVADVERAELRFSNAGHPCALHLARDGAEKLDDEQSRGPLMGIFPSAIYATAARPMAEGDRVMLFTDGLYEVEDATGRFFNEEQLRATVSRHAALVPEEFFERVVSDIRGSSRSGTFADDVCVVGMQIRRIG